MLLCPLRLAFSSTRNSVLLEAKHFNQNLMLNLTSHLKNQFPETCRTLQRFWKFLTLFLKLTNTKRPKVLPIHQIFYFSDLNLMLTVTCRAFRVYLFFEATKMKMKKRRKLIRIEKNSPCDFGSQLFIALHDRLSILQKLSVGNCFVFH